MPNQYEHLVFKIDFKIEEIVGKPRVLPIELGHPFSRTDCRTMEVYSALCQFHGYRSEFYAIYFRGITNCYSRENK